MFSLCDISHFRLNMQSFADWAVHSCSLSNPDKADSVLFGVEKGIASSGLHLLQANIMSGHDEGVAAWLAVNYLLERLGVNPVEGAQKVRPPSRIEYIQQWN